MSFEEAYIDYLKYAKKQHKKESFNSTTSIFKSRIIPFFSNKVLFDITKCHITEKGMDIKIY